MGIVSMDKDNEWGSKKKGHSKEHTALFMGIFALGIILILFGIFIGSISGVIHEPDQYNNDDYDSYETATRWLDFFSRLSLNSGMVMIACSTFITGVLDKNMHPTLRAGLVVSGGLIIGLNTVIFL